MAPTAAVDRNAPSIKISPVAEVLVIGKEAGCGPASFLIVDDLISIYAMSASCSDALSASEYTSGDT